MIKMLVYMLEAVVGMKYDPIERIIIIGGNKRFQNLIEEIIEDYFGVEIGKCEFRMTQKNKCCYKFKFSGGSFSKVKFNMIQDHFVVEDVKKLDRIML